MTKAFLTIVISALPFIGAAQSFTSLTFDQAKEKALKENKIILVDVMNSSQQTAEKMKMEKALADRREVKEMTENSIIAVRVDMGTPQGKEFAPLLQMNMYPTYAFLMPNGDLLGVVSPYLLIKNQDLFLDKAAEFLNAAAEKRKNTREIEFKKISFDEALKIAQSEGKLVFVDAITENCQPCMMMARNVFTLDKVADFYNQNFISLKLNLGTEYTDLAKRYNTFAYPTYLFINSQGELVHMESGFTPADEFIEYGKKALAKTNIIFEEGSWSEIVAKSKRENKPIFLDCYTTWCGPCKMMAGTVFTDPKVAEYFNATFINAKFDMEKGEGIELKGKFQIGAYPTYIYISPQGEVLNRLVGSMPADDFLEKSKNSLKESSLLAMQKRYASGERSQPFLVEYLSLLEQAYLKDDSRTVADEILGQLKPSEIEKPQYFRLFLNYLEDVDSELFKYVYSNRDRFAAQSRPAGAFEQKLRSVWENGSRRYVKGEGTDAVVDMKGFKEYIKRMKKEGVADYKVIVEDAKMYNAKVSGDWKSYYAIVNQKVKRETLEKLPEYHILTWSETIEKDCRDKEIRKGMAAILEQAIPLLEAKEQRKKEMVAKSGGMMAMSMINYPKEFARLLDLLKNN